MSRARKTVNVEWLKLWANEQLSRKDKFATYEFKLGIAVTIERVLHTSNCYEGYRYLELNNCEIGTAGEFLRAYY